jgi:ferritin-like metal-binding protein YciE
MSEPTRMPMRTARDLFIHELSDTLSGERLVAQMLEENQRLVQDPQLRQGLQQHEQETRQQIHNLEEVFRLLGGQPRPVECHAARGLFRSLQEVAEANPSPEVLEGAVVAGAAKTEHLEIAAYTGLVEKAQAMGQSQVAQLLRQNLAQEEAMLRRVEDVAQRLTGRMVTATPAGQ